MSFQKILKQLSVKPGNPRDLTLPCLKLYEQAMIIARRVEKPDENGYLSPAQVARHFEQLLYKELKRAPFEEKQSLEAIQDCIHDWYPKGNETPDGKNTNTVIQETLIAVLKRIQTDATQAKSPHLYKKKKQWRRDYIENLEACFSDLNEMAKAFNTHKAIAKHGNQYSRLTADELPLVLQAIDDDDRTTYKVGDARVRNTLIGSGFSVTEIQTIKISNILRYESAIAGAKQLLMAEYDVLPWSPGTEIKEHQLYIEILDSGESTDKSIRYRVKDASGNPQQATIRLKDIKQTLQNAISVDQLIPYAYLIFDIVTANGHAPMTLSKSYLKRTKELYNDVDQIMADESEFKLQLTKIAKPYLHYQQARETLLKTLNKPNTNITLKRLGQTILDETDALKKSNGHSLYELTNTLTIANKTIVSPTFENAQFCSEQGRKMAGHSRWRKAGSALLILAGVATILASVAVALFSFGALSPVTVLGAYLGASLISGGIAIGVGLLGAAAVAGGAKLSKAEPAKAQLRQSLANLAKENKTIIAQGTTPEASTDGTQLESTTDENQEDNQDENPNSLGLG